MVRATILFSTSAPSVHMQPRWRTITKSARSRRSYGKIGDCEQIMLLFVYTNTHKRFVIFTCRYFKLSGNTAALSQLNCRNLSCSSIKPGRPNKLAGNKRFITWPKREFSCGATLRISSGEDRPRTIRDNTDPFFNANLPNCPFSSPEPLGLICSRPRDQETTGYGDQNGNCHVKQLAYLRLLRHFSVKQTVRCLISLPK